MQAYQAIKMLKADRKEFLATYGLKSHMSKLPDSLVEELFGEEKKIQTEPEQTQTVDSAETDVVEIGEQDECEQTQDDTNDSIDSTGDTHTVDSGLVATIGELVQDSGVKSSDVETCPYDEATIRRSIRCLGNKSSAWKWRHTLNG